MAAVGLGFIVEEGEAGGSVLVLVHPDCRRRLGTDLAGLEPVAWAALADLLPAATRAAIRGRSTGAPAVVLSDCLAHREKRASWAEPTCERLAAILREWDLDVQAGSPSRERYLDACVVDVAGLEAPMARETVRRATQAVVEDGWLVVRGLDAAALGECVDQGRLALRLDPPYGSGVSVCHRDPAALEALASRLTAMLAVLQGPGASE